MLFALIYNKEDKIKFWTNLRIYKEELYMFNIIGGRCAFWPPTEMILELINKDSWDDLDYTKTSLCEYCGIFGWLAPDGTHYPCNYQSHREYAERILKSKERELEMLGYIKIGVKPFGDRTDANDVELFFEDEAKDKFSYAQLRWLTKNNLESSIYYSMVEDAVLNK